VGIEEMFRSSDTFTAHNPKIVINKDLELHLRMIVSPDPEDHGALVQDPENPPYVSEVK
jgi:hypothetical protein